MGSLVSVNLSLPSAVYVLVKSYACGTLFMLELHRNFRLVILKAQISPMVPPYALFQFLFVFAETQVCYILFGTELCKDWRIEGPVALQCPVMFHVSTFKCFCSPKVGFLQLFRTAKMQGFLWAVIGGQSEPENFRYPNPVIFIFFF